MKLLVDIGNTTIKFAIFNYKKEIIVFLKISSRKFIVEKIFLQKIINALNKIKIILTDITLLALVSVRPMWDNLFYKLSLKLEIPFYQVKKNLSINQLIINISNFHNLGADFIVSSYAIINLFPKQNVILINMGTATTISLLKKEILLGTIIMPGLEISAESLFEQVGS